MIRLLNALVVVFGILEMTCAAALPEHAPGELLVRFADTGRSNESHLQILQKALGGRAVLGVAPLRGKLNVDLVKLTSDGTMSSAIERLKSVNSIIYSEPNYIIHSVDKSFAAGGGSSGLPNNPDLSKDWAMHNVGQADSAGQIGIAGDDVNILPLWKNGITGSRKVIVAVVDSGIQWDHPDLAANLYTNPGTPGDTYDNDTHGWNFVANSNDTNDDMGHGTHCAGTIGAVGNSGVGIAGINWKVSLMPVKVLKANGGGTMAAAYEGLNYAIDMKANIMNLSWTTPVDSSTISDTISAAKDAGILVVAAAGNDGLDNDAPDTYAFPAAYDLPNLIAVAATDNKDVLADFSNFGAKSVHVAAPGVNIYSTLNGSSYRYASGTSMAAPFVAGIAALMLSEHPEMTYAEIKDRLIKTSTPVPGLKGKVLSGGVVNAANAFYGHVEN